MADDDKNESAASDGWAKDLAALWSAVSPHAWGLLLHVVPHTPQLLVRLLDLGLRAVPERSKTKE